MSRGYWITGIAAGLVIVPALAQNSSHPVFEGEPVARPRQQQSTGGSDEVANDQPNPATNVTTSLQAIESAIRGLVTKTDEAEAKRQIENDTRDLRAQENMAKWAKWMFWATLGTVLLTLAALIAIIRTLHHTRRAADYAEGMLTQAKRTTKAAQASISETRRIGEAQVRSYLSIKSCALTRLEGNHAQVHLVLRNSGQSPAKRVTVFLRASGGIRRRTDEKNRRIMDTFTLHTKDIGAQYLNRTLFGSVPAGGERDIKREYVVKDFDLATETAKAGATETYATVMVNIHSKSVFQRGDEETENAETWRGEIPGFFEVGSEIVLSPQWNAASAEEPHPTYNPKRKEEGED